MDTLQQEVSSDIYPGGLPAAAQTPGESGGEDRYTPGGCQLYCPLSD